VFFFFFLNRERLLSIQELMYLYIYSSSGFLANTKNIGEKICF